MLSIGSGFRIIDIPTYVLSFENRIRQHPGPKSVFEIASGKIPSIYLFALFARRYVNQLPTFFPFTRASCPPPELEGKDGNFP